MTPEFQRFLDDAGPVLFRAAAAWGGVGFALGVLLAIALVAGFAALGAWKWPYRRGGVLVRVLAWPVLVLSTGVVGAIAIGAVGVYRGAGDALLASDVAGPLHDVGTVGADLLVATVQITLDDAGMPRPSDAPEGDLVPAVREGRWTLPVSLAREVAGTLEARLRSPDGRRIAERLVLELPPYAPEQARPLVVQGVSRLTQAVAAGRLPSDLDPAFARAWTEMEAVAARDGRPDTLAHDELADLVVRHVVVPMGLRPLLAVLVPVAGTALAALLPIWGGILLAFWLARRWKRAPAPEP